MKARTAVARRERARSAPGGDSFRVRAPPAGAIEGSLQGTAASRYRTLFEIAGDGIFIADARGRYVDVNPMGCRMLGYTLEELLALSIVDIVASGEIARVRPETERLREGEALHSEWHFRRKDGTLFPGQVSATVLPDGYLMGILRDVTEDHLAMKRLSDAERHLRSVLDSLPVLIAVLRPDGTVIDGNLTALETFRQAKSEVVGRAFAEGGPWPANPPQQARLRAAIVQAAAGETSRIDTEFTLPDGSFAAFDGCLTPVRDEAGSVAYIVASGVDVSRRKSAEAALRASESRFRQLLESSIIGVIRADWNARILDANDAFLRMVDYTREDLAGGRFLWRDISSREERAADDRARAELDTVGVCTPFERALVRRDGTRVDVLLGAVRLEGMERETLCFVVDMTARKRAEAERASILERVTDAFVALDAGWRYTHVNEKAARTIGRPREDLIGKNIWTEHPVSVGGPFFHATHHAMNEQVPVHIEDYSRHLGVWLDATIYPSRDGVSIFFRDVTERRMVEEEIRRSREELRAFSDRLRSTRDEEARRIARELHDELGQALTGLKMDVASLARRSDGKGDTEMLAGMAATIDGAVRAVRRIATELRPPVLEDLGLSSAIEWLVEDFRSRSGVSVELESTIEGHRLEPDDEIAAFRIVQEALTNVARHAEATRVRVELTSRRDRFIVRVVDDGVGIPDPPGRGGPALGLVGMRERARGLGGTLAVERIEPRGTSVTLEMPVRDAEAAAGNPGGDGTS